MSPKPDATLTEPEQIVADLRRAKADLQRELAECRAERDAALARETATAEVLGVINSSPGDLAPVFDAMLEKAMRLCEAAFGVLWAYDGDRYCAAAVRGAPAAFVEFLRQPLHPHYHPGTGLERALRGENLVINDDMSAEEAYQSSDPMRRAIVDLGGARSHILVALRRDEAFFGAITVYRQEVRPFTDKQIALLQNFAAQAVIAMENARLLTETREALEQQTATAEVLGVINSSPGDLAPVFDAILEKAMRLCDAQFGLLMAPDGELHRATAHHGLPPALAEYFAQPVPMGRGLIGRLLAGEDWAQVVDAGADEVYRSGSPTRRALFDLGGARTGLAVALRKDHAYLGAFWLYRKEVRPFTDKQIVLLQNFAAQAVIAMENARLINETREALEQQTATAEVLGVINSSPGDLARVFDAMLEKAMSLSESVYGHLLTYDGEFFDRVAVRGEPRMVERQSLRRRAEAGITLKRIVGGEAVVQIADVMDTDAYRAGNLAARVMVEEGASRSLLTVALRREETLLGTLSVYRRGVRPYSDKQIALLQNFAAQAVIAMENARLITETREALEQQTATAEVLQVINSSPGDLAPVFDAMLERAMHLCGAEFGEFFVTEDERLRAVAVRGTPVEYAEFRHRNPSPPIPGSITARILAGEPVIHVTDVKDDDLYRRGDPHRRALVDLGGARTFVSVTLLKDRVPLGSINIYRQEVRPFSDKQIALLQNFAAQAVIAMENARLLTETREALEQQTATAEVLGVINSSPGDLAPVFDAILEKAHNLCGADKGSLTTYDGENFRTVATRGLSEPYATILCAPQGKPPGSPPDRLLQGELLVQVPDLGTLDFPIPRAAAEMEGVRTGMYLPLRRNGAFLGYITAYRQEVRPFTGKQIALLQNFAAQAVIAMENARLLAETREALQQQTATAEVLEIINSSPGDLGPVFGAMLERGLRLCEAAFGQLWTYDGDWFEMVAWQGMSPEFAEFLSGRHQPGPGTLHGRLLAGEDILHVVDMADDELYRAGHPYRKKTVELGGARSSLAVALRKDKKLLGILIIYRQEVRPFTDKQMALLQNFAAQAVIAIENAHLITELQQRTRDLQESLEYQTATSDALKVISRSTFNLQAVLDTLVETAAHLCGADHAGMTIREGDVFIYRASYAFETEFYAFLQLHSFAPGRDSMVGRVALEGKTVHIADVAADPEYKLTETMTLGKTRTLLGVPLLRDGLVIGTFNLGRHRVEPFTERQIGLVRTFADQAVIAMENARLLDELRQRTTEVDELNRSLEARVAEQVEELERVGRLKRFLAPQLAELIVSQGDEKILESHRRDIVVVFCDLRGYTPFTETAEPEEVLDFLREYHGALGPLVSQFEGTLDQFSGDGIMVFFNDPVPIPDAAERAVKMAVAMREAAGSLIADWRERGRELGFGAGIAQGYATLGQIGFSERSGYTAIGTVCNVAARLCDEAKDGQILLSQRVNVALKGSVATEQVGALALKGLTQPIVAYNVPLSAIQPALRVIDGGPP